MKSMILMILLVLICGWTGIMSPATLQALSIQPDLQKPVFDRSPTISDSPMRAAPQSHSESMQEQVGHWIATLSDTPEFSSWRNATWTSYPLGPGTHGWVIILENEGQEIGYMVVSAIPNESGFTLTEYGTGDSPLFSMKTLYRSLVQHGLISSSISLDQFIQGRNFTLQRIYINPFHAVWQVSITNEITETPTTVMDAKTAEIIPVTDALIQKLVKQETHVIDSDDQSDVADVTDVTDVGSDDQSDVANTADVGSKSSPLFAVSADKITAAFLLKPFDPFAKINFVKGQPLEYHGSASELVSLIIEGKHTTLTVEPFYKSLLVPFAMIGYQQWDNGQPYIILDQEGARFIQFREVARWGQVYQ